MSTGQFDNATSVRLMESKPYTMLEHELLEELKRLASQLNECQAERDEYMAGELYANATVKSLRSQLVSSQELYGAARAHLISALEDGVCDVMVDMGADGPCGRCGFCTAKAWLAEARDEAGLASDLVAADQSEAGTENETVFRDHGDFHAEMNDYLAELDPLGPLLLCAEPGCGNEVEIKGKLYCQAHAYTAPADVEQETNDA